MEFNNSGGSYLIIKIFYSLLCQHSFSGSMGLRHYCASQDCWKPSQSIMTSQSPFKQEFDIYKPQIRMYIVQMLSINN